MISIVSISISSIALLISIITFFVNKAKHNLQQLQTQYYRFNEKFQNLLNFGSYQVLTNFKYDLENVIIKDDADSAIDYNIIQKQTSVQIDSCKNAYAELLETIDFFETTKALNRQNSYKENEFVKWLNSTLNFFYLALNNHYTALYDINQIARLAQSGTLMPNAIETIKSYYDNIYKVVSIRETLLLLKREMFGVFNQSIIKGLGLFFSNTFVIKKLEKHIFWFIDNYGINEVIQKCDYTKIANTYKGLTDIFKNHIIDEENDFIIFINMLIEQSNISKKK